MKPQITLRDALSGMLLLIGFVLGMLRMSHPTALLYGLIVLGLISLALVYMNRMRIRRMDPPRKAPDAESKGRDPEAVRVEGSDESVRLEPWFNGLATEDARVHSERYQSIARNSGDVIWVMNLPTLRFRYINPAVERCWGFTMEEILRMSAKDVLSENSYRSFERRLLAQQSALAKGDESSRTWTALVEVVRKDGVQIPVEATVTLVSDEGGRVLSAEGIGRDISERRRWENEIRASRDEHMAVLDALPDIMFRVHGDGRVVYGHASSEMAFQVPLENFSGKTFGDFLPASEAAIMRDALAEAAKNGRHQGATFSFSGPGGLAWYELSIARMNEREGRPGDFIMLLRDVTARQKTVVELRLALQRLNEAQRLARVGSWEIDWAQSRLTWSPEMYQLMETDPQKEGPLTPENFIKRVHPDDRNQTIQNLSTTDAFVHQCRILFPDGRIKYMEGRGQTRVDARGNKIWTAGTLEDITDRKQAEIEKERTQAELQQAQKMESVGRLAGGIAHDFNNHLQAILGFSELVMEHLDPNLPMYADMAEIHKAAQYSADLTRQLLAFSRRQLIAPVQLDLNQAVAEMLRMAQRLVGEAITLDWMPASKLDPVFMDVSQFNQILINFCVNARDAMGGRGTIEIRTDNVTCDAAFCATRLDARPGAYVRLSVRDFGCGMTPEVMANIFEPFYTTKEFGHGSGLGLATIYGVVRQNNGFIEVESQPGAGSTFRVYLPRYEGTMVRNSAGIPETMISQLPKGRGETVLMVDDEESILEYSSRILRSLGYSVLSARTGTAALDYLRNHEGPIHAMFTDVVMPGVTGQELVREARARRPDTRCVFMSGYAADQFVAEGTGAQGVSALQKPFTGVQLATHVRKMLDEPPA